jgi:hypothetical protein
MIAIFSGMASFPAMMIMHFRSSVHVASDRRLALLRLDLALRAD